MSVRSQLEKKIEAKYQEIADLGGRLREAKAFLQGLQEALKILPKESMDEKKSEQVLRVGSDMAKVRDFLKKAGKPVHVLEILKGIGKDVSKKNRISVGGSLSGYSRKGQIFKKTAPNTFTLIEFTGNSEEELPEGFGTN